MTKMSFYSAVCMMAMTFNLLGSEASSADLLLQSVQSFVQLDCPLKEIVRPSARSQHNDHGSNPHIKIREATSLNWSGFAAVTNLTRPANNSVTSVTGVWTVPTLTSTSNTTYSSAWVGIDGYSSGSVEQIGTEHDWSGGSQHNYAWFEMYPSGAYEILNFPVTHGDVIAGLVSYIGNNTFLLALVNYTEQVFTVIPTGYTVSSSAKKSSAEWVVEAPSMSTVLPLADFGTISFIDCSATINGVTGSISNSHWVNESLTMESQTNVIKAQPSSLADNGTAFTVTWYHQ